VPKPLKDSRIGVYKRTIANGFVNKGEYIRGDYIGVFTWNDLIARIIPDLKQNRLKPSDYPVLITSWQLKPGNPSKPMPMPAPRNKLTVKAAGGKRNLKKMLGMPVGRKKDPRTEIWEAVVDSTDRAFKVVGQRIIEQS